MLELALYLCFGVAIATGLRVIFALRRYGYNTISTQSDDMPTVSICIAARNERHALTQSLERILSSGYQRLEILVLDDASEDNTSLVINSFAHAGVRFVPGRNLPKDWLGRNHAYHTLAQEASGDVVLFLDVDTLIKSSTVEQLVDYYVYHDLLMLSVLPRRDDSLRLSALFGSMRYMWELATSTKDRPPCTGGVWMIDRKTILKAIEQSPDLGKQMRIEHTIAHAARKSKRYRYLIAKPELGLWYEKRWHSQVETAQRLYYPMFGGTPLYAIFALLWLAAMAMPVLALFFTQGTALIIAIASTVLSCLVYSYYNLLLRRPLGAVIKSLLWPILIIQDTLLLIYSIVGYATRTVKWKGRHVSAQPRNHSHLRLN